MNRFNRLPRFIQVDSGICYGIVQLRCRTHRSKQHHMHMIVQGYFHHHRLVNQSLPIVGMIVGQIGLECYLRAEQTQRTVVTDPKDHRRDLIGLIENNTDCLILCRTDYACSLLQQVIRQCLNAPQELSPLLEMMEQYRKTGVG